jgi:hypothetical protein
MKRFFYLALLFFISFQSTAQTNQRVGVNTTTPEATLHVKTNQSDSDPFMVELNDSTKLKTFANGGTSVGSGIEPPKNGLLVKGTLRPDSGISTPQKLVVESTGNSITMKAGKNEVTIDASGNITIITRDTLANISIKSAGDLKLSGRNISLDAAEGVTIAGKTTMDLKAPVMNLAGTAKMDLKAPVMNLAGTVKMDLKAPVMNIEGTATMNIEGTGTMKLNAGIISLNNGGNPIAKVGSDVELNGGGGKVTTGTLSVLVP